jgi:hypothetical protein
VLLWTSEPRKPEVQEVLKPTRILDIDSTASGVRFVEGKMVMPQAHVVLVATKDAVQVFMVKTGDKDKAKVKKANLTIKLGKNSQTLREIFACEVISDTRVRLVAGNTFQVESVEVDLIEKDGSAFRKSIVVGDEAVEQKQAAERNLVPQVDIADAEVNHLLDVEEFDSMRKLSNATTVDTQAAADGSLANVLRQALKSNDQE